VEEINIDLEHLMSLGVILNEIISNSIKHHPKDKTIILDVLCFKKDGNIVLQIVDNGLGFDLISHKTGFGLALIKDFSKKLPEGIYSFKKDEGTIFELIFKDIKNNEN
jgi:two-component sensor histidine kinase